MSRNKKKPRKKTATTSTAVTTKEVEQQSTNLELSARIGYAIRVMVTALFLSRFFLTAENADAGGTLGIVMLWSLVVSAWFGSQLLTGECRLKFGWSDIAAYVLVAGHVISAGMILLTTGQKQHALNLMVEWIGVGMTLFMLRQTIQTSMDKSRLMIAVSILFSTIAGLGIYQHYVFYPSARAEYQKIAAGLEQTDQADELQALQEQLRQMGVPNEEPAKTLFLQRLMNSSEPFGFFALANTLAGILAVGFVMLLGISFGNWKQLSMSNRVAFPIMLALVGYCLLLSKSRTAQVGTFVGTVLLGILWFRSATQLSAKKLFLIIGSAACVLAVAIGVAALSGGVDLQILSEAPKSLLYRLEYWQGSLAVILESPILGVGPGNFRQAYLQHKLPSSSEEIADPHNMFLDVWANGGMLALLGLLGVLTLSMRPLRDSFGRQISDAVSEENKSQPWPVIPGLLIAIVLTYFVPLLLGVSLDDRILIVGLISTAIVFFVGELTSEERVVNMTAVAAFVALSVHLLGAGGIAMPGVVQLLLLCLVVFSTSSGSLEVSISGGIGKYIGIAVISLGSVVLLGSLAFRQHVGSVALEEIPFVRTEAEFLREINIAAENVPFSPDPWLILAGHEQNRWRKDHANSRKATKALQEAIKRDPASSPLQIRMGDWQMEIFRTVDDEKAAELALRSYEQAVHLYPTNSRNLSKWALALEETGNSAAAERVATQCLNQNQTNERLGHVDKVLDDSTVEKLRTFIRPD